MEDFKKGFTMFLPVTIQESITIPESYPESLYKLLRELGWTRCLLKIRMEDMSVWRKAAMRGDFNVWDENGSNNYEIVVPLQRTFTDFKECFDTMVNTLSKAEQKSKQEIMKMLREAMR